MEASVKELKKNFFTSHLARTSKVSYDLWGNINMNGEKLIMKFRRNELRFKNQIRVPQYYVANMIITFPKWMMPQIWKPFDFKI